MNTDAKQITGRERYRGFESIAIPVVVRVGTTRLTFAELSELETGTVVTLDSSVGSPFEMLTGGNPVALVEPIASEGDSGIALKLVGAIQQGASDDAAS